MKKICSIHALILCLIVLFGFAAFADERNVTDAISFEKSASLQELSDGVEVTIIKGKDGTWRKIDDPNIVMFPASIGPDGKIDIATFHLGLNHFNGNTAELYYRVTCDEPISQIQGNAVVKSDNALIGKIYYQGGFCRSVRSTAATVNFAHTNTIDPNEKKVRVSFWGVQITAYNGESASFPNNTKTVKLSSIRS